MSKFATPKPTTVVNSDMSHVIDDATSAMHDTYDETTSMTDTTVPLGEFLDEQIARSREREIIEPEHDDVSDDENMPPILRVIFLMRNLLQLFLLDRIDMNLRGC